MSISSAENSGNVIFIIEEESHPIDRERSHANLTPLVIALGIIIALGSIFVILAAHTMLPAGANVLSQLGIWGKITGYALIPLGALCIALGVVGESRQWRKFTILEVELHHSQGFSICRNKFASAIYKIGMEMSRPFLYEVNIATKFFSNNSRPGKSSEGESLNKKVCRVLNTIGLFTLVLPIITGLVASLGFCLRAVGAAFRPPASIIANEEVALKTLKNGDKIHLMTYNVALMPKFINNLNNMRSSKRRAAELGDLFLDDEKSPDIVCFQECFDLNATRILCEELKKTYPRVIHSVAPRETGLGSGLVIASMFDVEEIQYTAFDRAKGEDALANKGLLGIVMDIGNENKIKVYNTHLQAKAGEKYSAVRQEQVEQIKDIMEADHANEKYSAVFLAGDFNLSHIDEQGQNSDEYQATEQVLSAQYFSNVYYNFHGKVSNLDSDKPIGSWYKKKESHWGTANWEHETVDGCVLDHIFVYKTQIDEDLAIETSQTEEDVYVQVRKMEEFDECVSGYSDHRPLEYFHKLTNLA